jgi:DNA-directed RNA polymerase specialized sigma24 family protein
MEIAWNKKRIQLLLASDGNTVEEYLQQFAPFVYTWLFYRVGANADIAADLTSHSLSQSLKTLSDFNPTQDNLSQWLKRHSAEVLNEALETGQIEPRRPLEWSQLSDEILGGLSRFRLDLFDQRIQENPCVHEIARAALSELEATNRQLLIDKYCHLDSVEHIAEEMGARIEDVEDQLYRSRHSFRREFLGLIASANDGFLENSDTGDIKVQETNLEKLLSTTPVYLSLASSQWDAIRKEFLQALAEIEPPRSTDIHQNKRLKTSIAFLVIIALITIFFLTVLNKSPFAPELPVAQTDTFQKTLTEEAAQSRAKKATQNAIDEEELKRVFELGKAGNVDALLEILKSGQFVSQRMAAPFIGNLADPSAIDLLLQAEEKWYPKALGNNPFAEAIKQILARHPDAIPPDSLLEAETAEPESGSEPNEPETAEEELASIPNITGLVSDFSNQPIPNAILELRENLLFSKSNKVIQKTETNPLGQYQFSNIDNQGVILTCQLPGQQAKQITRRLWCRKDSLCVLNIGGRPALTGSVTIDGTPLSNQKLYLTDTLDMGQASFLEEAATDLEGSFSFLGVAPGEYFIISQDLDGSLNRLQEIKMPQQELFNVNMEIDTIPVWLDYRARSEQDDISGAFLVYMPNAPDSYGQIQAVLSEDDSSLLFENVIPGTYILRSQLNNGVWIQENIEIDSTSEDHMIQLEPFSEETATISGYFLNDTTIDLFLTTANQRFHIDIEPNSDGTYELTEIPSDIYSLAGWVNNQLIEFLQIDLQS